MTFDIHITVELQPSPQLVELFQSWQSEGHKIRPQPGPQGSTPVGSDLPEKPPIGDIDALLKVSSEQPAMPSMGETERLLHPGPEQPVSELDKFMKERKEQKRQDIGWDPLVEIPKFSISECTTKEHVPIPELSRHFEYIETTAGRLWFRYISGNVWTTWDHIMKLERSLPADQKKFGKLLRFSDKGNRRTAINYMIKAIRAGLVAGQAAGSQAKGKISNSEFLTGKEKTPGDQKEPGDPDADFRPQLPPGTIDTSTGYDGSKLEGSLGD